MNKFTPRSFRASLLTPCPPHLPALQGGKWKRINLFSGGTCVVFSAFTLEGYFCHFNDSFDSNCPVQAEKRNCHGDVITLTLVINPLWSSNEADIFFKVNDKVSNAHWGHGVHWKARALLQQAQFWTCHISPPSCFWSLKRGSMAQRDRG